MFYPHTQRKALCLQGAATALQHFVYVACRMTCCEDYRNAFILRAFGSSYREISWLAFNCLDTRPEMVFAAMLEHAVSDILHDYREFIRADMRMGIVKDFPGCSELH